MLWLPMELFGKGPVQVYLRGGHAAIKNPIRQTTGRTLRPLFSWRESVCGRRPRTMQWLVRRRLLKRYQMTKGIYRVAQKKPPP
jgi:hypothetical protein